MDKRAAEQYLDRLFGQRTGYVAVAHKVPNVKDGWKEDQFAWPSEKAKLISWAEKHQNHNVFICPALRKQGNARRKGDMQPTQFLWADVDWQAIPTSKIAEVEKRIESLGTLVVGSGSKNNCHVYVELSSPVEYEDFIKLNTGLRDYLYADAKHPDNSVLRLPGTTNWKTEFGSPVAKRGGNDRKQTAASLLKLRPFRDAKVPVDAEMVDWEFVQVEGLPRHLARQLGMGAEEAKGRYGTRHDAVYAMVRELSKRNMNADQIHSLMNRFPPALDKMADENGYDLHEDISRCYARILQADKAMQVLSPEEQEDLEDDVMELATKEDDDEEFERRVNALVAIELERSEARKRARIVEAERSWVPPPNDVSWSLTDALKDPPRAIPHLIQGLCGEKHNVVLTAQYKTGKTAFTMGSIAQSLSDGTSFLDKFEVNTPPGGVVVGHWNCEMDPDEMVDDYIRPVGIDHTDNLHVANLRGYAVNILTPLGKAWAVEWLRQRKVKVWTIDSFARLSRMAGVSEKDNDEVMGLLMVLDQIKIEAEVNVLFLITHTGRGEMEEGKERARGATAIDDWADARWIMTKMDKTRFLRVEGRGVDLEDTALVYDQITKRSVAGFGGKAEVKEDGGNQAIARVVQDKPGITQRELYAVLKGSMSQRVAAHHIEEAIEAGLIEVRDEHRGRGKPAKCHYLAGSLQGETRHHNATAAMVDLRGVGIRRTRRRTTV